MNTGQTIATKPPAQLVEVAQYVRKRDGVSHAVLASGSGDPPRNEIPYLASCVEALKTATELPVHAQFIPPKDLELLDVLCDSGVDTVGIHIQKSNVSFFYKLGWKPAGPLEYYVNRPHRLMEADLEQVPEDLGFCFSRYCSGVSLQSCRLHE